MSYSDYGVIGLGGMGSAALMHLALAGKNVTGLELLQSPHDMGSSHGETRIYRKLYYEHPDYVPMLLDAERQWLELNDQSSERLFYPAACFSISRPESPVFSGALESGQKYKLKHKVLNRETIGGVVPGMIMPEGYSCCFDPEAGVVVPEAAIRTQLKIAEKHGAAIHQNTKVKSVNPKKNRVEVETDSGTFTFGTLVLTAGAWTAKLVPGLDGYLKPVRTVMHFFEISDKLKQSSILPTFILENDEGESSYGLFDPQMTSVKGGVHYSLNEEKIDPDTLNRDIIPGEEKAFKEFLKAIFGDEIGAYMRSKVCMYTHSPDEQFIMDTMEDGLIVYAAGFSGHGFKFCPVIGEILKDMALGEQTKYNTDFLKLTRLKK